MAFYEDIVVDQNSKTRCELCKIFIDESSIELHLNDKEHNIRFMKKTMIQNSIMINGNHVLCGICEELVDFTKIVNHIQSVHHKTKMGDIKQIILKDGGFLILPEQITDGDRQVNCLICDCSVKFGMTKVKDHIATLRHQRARSIAIQPLNAIFSVEDSKDDLWCKICQVYFENYIETIFEHVDENPKHVRESRKLFLLIKDQNISIQKFLEDPKEDKAYCNKCAIEVPCNLDNLGSHVRGKKHNS